MNLLLCTSYLPPVSYMHQLLQAELSYIELHEHFIKQSIRNRCTIYSANGPLSLSIPLIKQGLKEKTKDKKISYSEKWQNIHWRAITSAYQNSPYFEYLEADFKPFFEKRYVFLIDFNLELITLLLHLLRSEKTIHFTHEYQHHPGNLIDYRNPENNLADYEFTPYYQTFASKYGFIPNLSCLDVLFHEGKYAQEIILSTSRKSPQAF